MNMQYVGCVDHGTRFMDLDNLVVEMCDKCRVVGGVKNNFGERLRMCCLSFPGEMHAITCRESSRRMRGQAEMQIYRLSWETVDVHNLWEYCNADPRLFSNITQTTPNSEIPDEAWHSVSVETEDPWDQYRQLKEWSDADMEFIRNVKLEEQISEPVWKVVSDPRSH